MKKSVNVIMILLLLLATGGIPFTRHYCGQSIISVSLFSTPKPCCGSDCDKCHNENSFNKVTDNFTVSSFDEVKSIDTINPVHCDFIIDFSRSLPATPIAEALTPRKFLIAGAGHSPASLGNFRC
jgi:hypothetical protein